MYQEIRIREAVAESKAPRYVNVDLGAPGADRGRGEVTPSATRPLPGGMKECVTFMARTYNNIAQMLGRGLEVCTLEEGAWAPVNRDLFFASVFGSKEEETEKAPEEEAEGPAAAEVTIASLEDFAGLSKKDQMEALRTAGFPAGLAKEISESSDERLGKNVVKQAALLIQNLDEAAE